MTAQITCRPQVGAVIVRTCSEVNLRVTPTLTERGRANSALAWGGWGSNPRRCQTLTARIRSGPVARSEHVWVRPSHGPLSSDRRTGSPVARESCAASASREASTASSSEHGFSLPPRAKSTKAAISAR